MTKDAGAQGSANGTGVAARLWRLRHNIGHQADIERCEEKTGERDPDLYTSAIHRCLEQAMCPASASMEQIAGFA